MYKVVILVEVSGESAPFVERILEALQNGEMVSRFKEVSNPSETCEYLGRARLEKSE
jgi:hypothetical protein